MDDSDYSRLKRIEDWQELHGERLKRIDSRLQDLSKWAGLSLGAVLVILLAYVVFK